MVSFKSIKRCPSPPNRFCLTFRLGPPQNHSCKAAEVRGLIARLAVGGGGPRNDAKDGRHWRRPWPRSLFTLVEGAQHPLFA